MGATFYIAQILGALTTVIIAITAQLKNMKTILLLSVCANLMTATSSFLLGGLSGAWLCGVGALQTAVLYFVEKSGAQKRTRNILLAVFAVMYVGGTVLVYQGWGDLISCTGALIYLLAIIQTKPAKYRCFAGANALLWLLYDITILAFGSMITHTVALASAVVGIIRLDIKKRPPAEHS